MSIALPYPIGTPIQGGFFGGIVHLDGEVRGIALAPQSVGRFSGQWLDRRVDVPGARHCVDGLTNTRAMAEAGSDLAKEVLALRVGEFDDWHIPARDVLEVLYRSFKPTARENACSFRDGENPSAVPPTYGYTSTVPAQTALEAFQKGGVEAFDADWYWASTQYSPGYAWIQDFADGFQHYDDKDNSDRACAVRMFAIR